MKMKRYVAADMRSALRAIREEQGPDAVILSSRPTRGGVEVCAAVDIELAVGQGTLAETAALKQLERATIHELEREAVHVAAGAFRPSRAAPADDVVQLSQLSRATDQAQINPSVGEELRILRGLLEQQLAALAWNDFTRREPQKARALTDLANLGLDRTLALEIVDEMPPALSVEQVAAHALCIAVTTSEDQSATVRTQWRSGADRTGRLRQDHHAVKTRDALCAGTGRRESGSDFRR
jgi:flagellar biosynthesis protein FlhF